MKLSIFAKLSQSAAYLAEFHRRAIAAAQALVGNDFEICQGVHPAIGRVDNFLYRNCRKMSSETEQRPYTIVRHVHGKR